MVQFMKGRKDTGEYLMSKKLRNFSLRHFGSEKFIDLKNPSKEDIRLAGEGLKYAEGALKKKPDLLILDEINLAASAGLIKASDVLSLLSKAPAETTVVLTGRRAPKEFLERADLVTEMVYVRHPFDAGVESREGLDY
jgi:cob(I)alamin adenosyltransferase